MPPSWIAASSLPPSTFRFEKSPSSAAPSTPFTSAFTVNGSSGWASFMAVPAAETLPPNASSRASSSVIASSTTFTLSTTLRASAPSMRRRPSRAAATPESPAKVAGSSGFEAGAFAFSFTSGAGMSSRSRSSRSPDSARSKRVVALGALPARATSPFPVSRSPSRSRSTRESSTSTFSPDFR